MPNWAWGIVTVKGTKINITKFVNRFIYDGDSQRIATYPYFARSFINDSRQSVLNEIDEVFDGIQSGAESVCELLVDFAWSAYSCLIDGYPQDSQGECITLSDACVEDQVSVVIQTEEGGLGFEELVTCDKEGTVTSTEKELQPYKCQSCGTIMSIASFHDADEYSCHECGEVGLDPVPEEAQTAGLIENEIQVV